MHSEHTPVHQTFTMGKKSCSSMLIFFPSPCIHFLPDVGLLQCWTWAPEMRQCKKWQIANGWSIIPWQLFQLPSDPTQSERSAAQAFQEAVCACTVVTEDVISSVRSAAARGKCPALSPSQLSNTHTHTQWGQAVWSVCDVHKLPQWPVLLWSPRLLSCQMRPPVSLTSLKQMWKHEVCFVLFPRLLMIHLHVQSINQKYVYTTVS